MAINRRLPIAAAAISAAEDAVAFGPKLGRNDVERWVLRKLDALKPFIEKSPRLRKIVIEWPASALKPFYLTWYGFKQIFLSAASFLLVVLIGGAISGTGFLLFGPSKPPMISQAVFGVLAALFFFGAFAISPGRESAFYCRDDLIQELSEELMKRFDSISCTEVAGAAEIVKLVQTNADEWMKICLIGVGSLWAALVYFFQKNFDNILASKAEIVSSAYLGIAFVTLLGFTGAVVCYRRSVPAVYMIADSLIRSLPETVEQQKKSPASDNQ